MKKKIRAFKKVKKRHFSNLKLLRFLKFRAFLKKRTQGQGLIEYLILVALMGVATIVVLRLLNHTITAKFTDVIYALQGNQKKSKKESVKEDVYKKKDLKNFMNGAASRKNED